MMYPVTHTPLHLLLELSDSLPCSWDYYQNVSIHLKYNLRHTEIINQFLLQNSMKVTETAEDFLQMADKFKLGCLDTEKQHTHTIGLSVYAKNDLKTAINKVKDLDTNTISVLKTKINELYNLYLDINDTLATGGRVFVCGCGATGRLSLVLEALWRFETRSLNLGALSDKVVSFMAGGDAAIIKSVEDFQDHPQFAEQQLLELNFSQNDLMIGSTQGGETWWVIGSVWKSVNISKRKPYILYGNSDEILCQNVERSRQYIESDKILKINMSVGSMAIAGSTRMQSTTILMYGIGLSLLGTDQIRDVKYPDTKWREYAEKSLTSFQQYFQALDLSIIAPLIEFESEIYKKGETISYLTDPYYAISILTDTTERAPTFSLNAFENIDDQVQNKCWCNMVLVSNTDKSQLSRKERVNSDWEEMLGGRPIRSLDSAYWEKYQNKVSLERCLGFTMHIQKQHSMRITHPLQFSAQNGITTKLPQYPLNDILSHHILLKMILNNLSTLIMGRMDRYQSNVMTYVRASNYKLIDRAARMVMMLKADVTYEDVIRSIYEVKPTLKQDEPIVLKVIEHLNSFAQK